jgi:FlaA1/EpsC-like NDP-sugar epimerase
MNFKDKIVCVTGAGGSIGSELCVQLIAQGVKQLRAVCLTEGALFNLQKRMPKTDQFVSVLGSVLDTPLMQEVFDECDAVIHAAAHKHVPICEAHPLAAIYNNVEGTYCVALATFLKRVPLFVYVSSDKAVFPLSIMGATKRAAELIVRAAGVNKTQTTKFVTVRFGNVLDSAGSVLPLWREQIAAGGPLTMTDPECERYFMSIPQAVELILNAAGFEGGNPYVFDMGEPRKMGEIAQSLMDQMGRTVKIKISGLRPGEKIRESLHHGGTLSPTAHPKIFQVNEDGTKNMNLPTLFKLFELVGARKKDEAVKLLWDSIG